MDKNRGAAFRTLLSVEEEKAYSNIELNKQLAESGADDPAFVRELTYGVLENKIWLDHILDQLVDHGIESVKKQDLTILRMGLYQMLKMDSVPDYAAINESVALAKRFARGRGGFINGVLRSYEKKKDSITFPDPEEDPVSYLSVKYSYEPWIVELWLDSYDREFTEALLAAGNETPDMTIRYNWLKVMKQDLIDILTQGGYEVANGSYAVNALKVKGPDLLATNAYKNGLFSVQDEASQLTAEILDPKKGDTVVDVCAAPGGKTMAIAERMNNTGEIIAQDIYKRKVDLIDKEAKRLGVTIVKTRTWDATRVDSTMVGKADRVICDVPCSGLGVVRRKPEIKYKKETEEFLLLPKKQLTILNSSAQYVKPGGVLMYCTCTINPAENEEVVSSFLKNHGNFRMVETKQLFPHTNGTDGFFICKMEKSGSIVE